MGEFTDFQWVGIGMEWDEEEEEEKKESEGERHGFLGENPWLYTWLQASTLVKAHLHCVSKVHLY